MGHLAIDVPHFLIVSKDLCIYFFNLLLKDLYIPGGLFHDLTLKVVKGYQDCCDVVSSLSEDRGLQNDVHCPPTCFMDAKFLVIDAVFLVGFLLLLVSDTLPNKMSHVFVIQLVVDAIAG